LDVARACAENYCISELPQKKVMLALFSDAGVAVMAGYGALKSAL